MWVCGPLQSCHKSDLVALSDLLATPKCGDKLKDDNIPFGGPTYKRGFTVEVTGC